MAKPTRDPADFIVPLTINGLDGRMLHIPAQKNKHNEGKKREILFVYGQHSLLERWWGLAEVMSEYGDVTMPDLPGFGGMDSFYKIGKKPTIDNMADYLAAFMKWRYRRKKVTIAGGSYGFVVVTRMLQLYPELTSKVSMLVSFVGFAHYQDFLFSPGRMALYRIGTAIFSHNPQAWLVRHLLLRPALLRRAYQYTYSGKHKFAALSSEEFASMMDMEVKLWQANDVRTHWFSAHEFLYLNNCGVHVDLPVWHIAAENDHFFNNIIVEQHFRMIFSDYYGYTIKVPNHGPSVIADAEMAAPFIPDEIRHALRNLP